MEKLDLFKTDKRYYSAKTMPELIELPATSYLSVEGVGDPSGDAYLANVQALYGTAYAIKFACKAEQKDFVVARLEGLWNFDMEKYGHLSAAEAPLMVPRSEWMYRLLIRMPEYVTEATMQVAKQKMMMKKKMLSMPDVSLYKLPAQKVVQMLHNGPFKNEPETLVQMQEFIEQHALARDGWHHEIYLTDFNRTAPEKLRTILREPVK